MTEYFSLFSSRFGPTLEPQDEGGRHGWVDAGACLEGIHASCKKAIAFKQSNTILC